MNLKFILNEKGSFMIEAVLSFMLFLIIFTGIIEVFSLVESKLYVEKISRDICHEAAITSINDANAVKELFVKQYFPEEERPYVYIEDLNKYSTDNHIHCYVAYYHKPFKFIFPSDNNGRRVAIDATSIFPNHTSRK